ncbi:MAG: hypothetical protein E6J68_12280 [Deltaproteobacteria bacterium]|nr:MAG: hypothetical protein E6J68_12280 [Deltaproteobacteria bacterium]
MSTQRLPPLPSDVVPVEPEMPRPVTVIGTAIVTAAPTAVSCVTLTEPPQLPAAASAAIEPPVLAPLRLTSPLSASNVIEPPAPPGLPAVAAL